MAEKLRYDVEVNTRDGVRELDRLGTAGKEAGEEIEEGFDGTESAAKQAASALVAAAKEIAAALEADKAAADALALALGPELSAKIDSTEAVAELKKLGLTADDVKADADTLAIALKEIDDVNLGGVRSELDKVDDGMRKVGDSSDNSRSVMANLSGNAVGELSAVAGATGPVNVALGQLAEYATEGNISLRGFAGVAGPMLALTAAVAAVGVITGNNAKKQAQYTALQEGFTKALEDTTNAADAANVALSESQEMFAGFSTLGWEGQLTERIPVLSGMVDDLTLSTEENIEAMADAGISVKDWSNAVAGDQATRTAFVQSMKDMVETGELTEEQFQSLAMLFGEHGATLRDTTATTEDWAAITTTSAGDINNALAENVVNLSRTQTFWKRLLNDVRDGNIDTVKAADAWNILRDELGLTNSQMAAMTQTKLDETLQTFADVTAEATGAAEDHTEALQAEADALGLAAEAAQDAADAQRATVDSVYALESAQEDLNDARATYLEDAEEFGEGSVEATRSLRDLRDAAIDVADAEVQLARDRAKSNRVTYTSVDAIDDENDALLRQAATLQGPERQAILTHIASVNDIPADVLTTIETLIDQGKYDEALALLEDVSGRRDLAIEAEVTKASQAIAQAAIDKLTQPETATVTVNANVQPALDAIARLRLAIRGAQIAAAAAATAAGQRSAPAGPTAAPLPAASSTVVTLNLPRGTRPNDAVYAIDNYARRNGGTRARR